MSLAQDDLRTIVLLNKLSGSLGFSFVSKVGTIPELPDQVCPTTAEMGHRGSRGGGKIILPLFAYYFVIFLNGMTIFHSPITFPFVNIACQESWKTIAFSSSQNVNVIH